MAAANTDKFRQGTSNISTTLQSAISSSDSSLTPASVANMSTLTAIDISIDRVDSSGNLTPSKWERMIGVVSGGNIVTLLRGQDNSTAVAHSTGAVIEMMPTGKWSQDLVAGILTQHNQDGTHAAITAPSATFSGTVTAANFVQTGGSSANGWNVGLATPNTVVANGNRSYTLTFNATDLTSTISPGMRLRTTRTVAAPTQCTNLNGTTQYYSKASPAGMTFTNNFVVSAWVKLNSYPAAAPNIVGRRDGTGGWDLTITASGQVRIEAFNGSTANGYRVDTYQSIPLNKWVHVAAQMDMTGTATTGNTNSYIMIDGVEVPSTGTRTGTNPTSLTQGAGPLEIGDLNTAAFFPGKIAQVAIYSAKVTQATILASMNQGLAGTETSLISAYSFNNSINDLSSNANNLTANGSAVATNADSPFGGQAGGTISSTLDYGIVQSASFSTNTTVVVQVPEGCTIPTSGGVSAVAYSTQKAPYGMPVQRGKWQVMYLNRILSNVAGPVVNTWYNVGAVQITIPIGEWVLGYNIDLQVNVSSGIPAVESTLSTSASAESSNELTAHGESSLTQNYNTPITEQAPASLSSLTVYYLLGRSVGGTTSNVYFRGDYKFTKITAENSYL